MQEWVTKRLRQEDNLTKLLRKKRGGPVGNCEPERPPLGQVVAVAILPEIKVGDKSFTPEVRIVQTSSNETVFIEGGMNNPISANDAKKLLPSNEKGQLTKTMNRVVKKRTEKLKAIQQLS